MAAEQERQLGHRNRAFARRIAARARPQAVATRPLLPGWIQRARHQATALAEGGIQPRVHPAATLRLARPVTTRTVEDAPPLPLARPVATAAEIEPVLEVARSTPRTAPEPTAAPFRMADVRRELAAAQAEARPTRQDAPTSPTPAPPARGRTRPAQPTPGPDGAAPAARTRPADRAPTPSEPAPLRRAISRLEEEPEQEAAAERTQVEADATVEREPAPTEAVPSPAAPTPPPKEDRRSEGAAPSTHEDESRARQAEALPTAPDAQEARPVRPLPVDTADQPPSVEAPQAVAPQPSPELGTAPPLVGASDATEAEPRPEPGAPPPLVGARQAEPSRPAEAQEARPVRPLPVDTADQPPAAEAPPVAPPSTTAEPPTLRRRPVSTPEAPATPSTERPVRDADATPAVEQARVGARPAEPLPASPEATPPPSAALRRVEEWDRDQPSAPDATRAGARPGAPTQATPEPDAPAAGESQAAEGHLPRQAVPLEQALFGDTAAAEPPPGAEEHPIAPSTAAPAGASEPGPPVRRIMAQTPASGPAVSPPIRRAPASPSAPAAQPEPEVTVRRQSEAESASAPATAAPSTGASETQAEPAAQPSVQEIAEEVWALIRDRIRVERERLGRP